MKNKELKTFKVLSMGCKVNYYETEAISAILERNNLSRVNLNEIADISIINTCTVTEEASRKTKQMIRRMVKMSPDSIIVVSGCLAQVDETIKDIDGVNILIGTNYKDKIFDYIQKYNENCENIYDIKDDIFHSCYENLTLTHFEAHTRAFLKVEDGCNNFCSYCIIPYARGNVRSKPLNVCIKEAEDLVKSGHKEIVVTGIDTGSYGKDINTDFYTLLDCLSKIDGLKRIRISSLEITQLTEKIIDLIKNNEKIVKHIHIPIQSGSNRILKLMNRHYDKEYFIKKIEYIRKNIPNISITTDFIVGFPSETSDDFNESLMTLKTISFDTIHTFPYSKRLGTKASLLKDVDSKIKKERSKIVLELSKNGYNSYVSKNIGLIHDIIFETFKDGYIYGHTGNYIYCKAKGTISSLNKLLKVKLIKLEIDAVLTEIINE